MEWKRRYQSLFADLKMLIFARIDQRRCRFSFSIRPDIAGFFPPRSRLFPVS